MTYYKKIFKESLENKKDGNYRIFADLEKIAEIFLRHLIIKKIVFQK